MAKMPRKEVEEGTTLLKSLLDEWKSRVEEGETTMDDDTKVQQLKVVVGEYKDRFETNPWVKALLEAS